MFFQKKPFFFMGTISDHGFVIDSSKPHTIWGFGLNGDGQLGLGNDDDVDNLTEVTFFSQAKSLKSVACGGYHSIFLAVDGRIWGAGKNIDGQLANGTKMGAKLPVEVSFFKENGINVFKIQCGGIFSVFQTEKNLFYAAGHNGFKQVGGSYQNQVALPVKVELPTDELFVDFAVGSSHVVFLSKSGKMYSQGYNDNFQISHKKSDMIGIPTKIDLGMEYDHLIVKEVKCGGNCTLARAFSPLKRQFFLVSMGRNHEGQLACDVERKRCDRVVTSFGELLPRGSKEIKMMGIGYLHSVFLSSSGELFVSGSNSNGQIQRHSCCKPELSQFQSINKLNQVQEFLKKIPGNSNKNIRVGGSRREKIKAIYAGWQATYVELHRSGLGELWGFGLNAKGQLGRSREAWRLEEGFDVEKVENDLEIIVMWNALSWKEKQERLNLLITKVPLWGIVFCQQAS